MDLMMAEDWKRVLRDALKMPYFQGLKKFVEEDAKEHILYPDTKNIFNAFTCTPFENVKVVILGQDPYHGQNQAHGLAFSVQNGIAHPPSLKNIFKELEDDIQTKIPENGDLSLWAKQGVFLLNTVLTVRANEPNSHRNKGWEEFTDTVIKTLSAQKEHLVFILWGKPAETKERFIDEKKHLILKAPHPSPLSSYRGFFGSKPFSKSNEFLTCKGLEPIDWNLD
ncbi:MAG: uracil-DNA glycosylase [Sulfurospirillaceae bacterium]|nr:uracil-DNA glycosylase [Sulfurospirillaceae bacterium]